MRIQVVQVQRGRHPETRKSRGEGPLKRGLLIRV